VPLGHVIVVKVESTRSRALKISLRQMSGREAKGADARLADSVKNTERLGGGLDVGPDPRPPATAAVSPRGPGVSGRPALPRPSRSRPRSTDLERRSSFGCRLGAARLRTRAALARARPARLPRVLGPSPATAAGRSRPRAPRSQEQSERAAALQRCRSTRSRQRPSSESPDLLGMRR
jgi:hypothetical protein